MNFTVNRNDDTTGTFTAIIPADVVTQERKAISAKYTKHAKVPGFRPGKAPESVIAKRFSKEINEELISLLNEKAIQELSKAEPKLRVIDIEAPTTSILNEDGTYTLEAPFTYIPEFDIPEYKGLEISVEKKEVTDADIDKALAEMTERYADYEVIEKDLALGDVAIVNFTTACEDKTVAEVIGKPAGFLDGREGQWIRIEEDTFLPGYATALVGLKAGDKKDVTVTIPESFPLSDLVGKDVTLKTEIVEAREKKVPALDDEFAKKIIPDGDLATLKERMKAVMENSASEAAENAKLEQIANKLTEAVGDFALPEALVEAASQDLFRNKLQSAFQSLQGVENIEAEIEKIKEECKNQAAKNLRTHFILQSIAQKEEVQVSNDDLSREVYRLAQMQNKDPKVLVNELRKNGQFEGVFQGVLSNKTIAFILELAKVTETPVTEVADDKENN